MAVTELMVLGRGDGAGPTNAVLLGPTLRVGAQTHVPTQTHRPEGLWRCPLTGSLGAEL